MEIYELIKSAEQIADFCKDHESCSSCPFLIGKNKINCLFNGEAPFAWGIEKLNGDVLFLLSKEETESSFDKEQLKWNKPWWLRSDCPNESGGAFAIYLDGHLENYRVCDALGVRPAFKADILKNKEPSIQIGETLGEPMKWKLSEDSKFYLLHNYIMSVPFQYNKISNDYSISYIRKIVKQMEEAFLEDAKKRKLLAKEEN